MKMTLSKKILFYLLNYIFSISITVFGQTKNLQDGLINPFAPNKYWEIVCTRSNVPVYRDKHFSAIAPDRKVNFAEQFAVYDTSEGLTAYQIEIERNKYWVEGINFLPNNECIKNSKGISIKACLVFRSASNYVSNIYYNTPEENKNLKLGEANLYDFYFVYDYFPRSHEIKDTEIQNAEFILLGNKPIFQYFEGSNSTEKVLLGWFKKTDDVVIWNTRVALEPNLSEEARIEKRKNHIYATIWQDEENAARFSEGSPSNPQNIMSSDKNLVEENKILLPSDYRYPIFEKKVRKAVGKTVYKIGFAGNVPGQRMKAQLEEKLEKNRHIDILFVIDATKSMAPYLRDLPQAIKNAADFLNVSFSKYHLSWGLAVFRNNVDLNNAAFPIYQKYGITDSLDIFKRNIDKVRAGSASEELPESMFYGATQALDHLFTEQSKGIRITIVITDVKGESHKTINEQGELVKEYNEATTAEALQARQSHLIVMNVGGRQYKRELKNQIENIIQRLNKHDFVFDRKTIPDLGNTEVYYIKNDQNLQKTYTGIYVEIQSKDYYDAAIQQMVKDIVFKIDSTAYSVRFQPALKSERARLSGRYQSDFTFALNFEINFAEIDFSNENIAIIFKKGYVATSRKGLQQPLFIPVIFISQEQLSKLSSFLTTMYEKIYSPKGEQSLQDIFKELLKDHLGEFFLLRDSAEFLREIGSGVPMVCALVQDYMDEKLLHLSREDKRNFSAKISKSSQELVRILKEKGFKYGIDEYYWIKLSDLP